MANLKVVFLGTSGSTPSKERNLSSTCINFNGQNFLFDCSEGTQRQIMQSGLSFMKVDFIFISHFHGDHILGLPGLLATMTMQERQKELFITGPKGIGEKVKAALWLSGFRPSFPLKVKELKRKEIILKEKNFKITAFPLKHEIPCFGFVFEELRPAGKFVREKALKLGIPEGPLWRQLQQGKGVKLGGKSFKPEQVLDFSQGKKGKKVAIVMDTTPKYNISELTEADVLVHEASLSSAFEQRAKETRHSTAAQAAGIAKKARVKKLFITHVSTRHQKEIETLEKEAQAVFPNSKIAKDLETVEL
ncbi:MAG TPA: ribonuclease Z [Candidatus Diapherotrites archaeon]|uniref:Ribonuclease Z n=1 Tax=Candidatus Iainarchaeum sp. TaxID=3101447 RepID=A0A7J4KUE7_9ARCH|nr:ribonuclease Z [Candidatus Diapherotrites archaeon]